MEEESRLKCKFPCDKLMNCGKHTCKNLCGEDHSHAECKKLVDTQFACGHALKKMCYQDDFQVKCRKEILKHFTTCTHSIKIECYKPLPGVQCHTQIVFVLPCGHKNVKACHEKDPRKVCNRSCTKDLLCSHKCTGTCGEAVCGPCVPCKELARFHESECRKQALAKAKMLKNQLQHQRNIKPFRQSLEPLYDEFDGIKELVHKYIVPHHNWFPLVKKIERVVNLPLEIAWCKARSEMVDPVANSWYKFHGTDDTALENICFGEGFRLPAPSKNNMFGQGVYFASNSSKSAQKIYTKNSNKLIVSLVLLGRSLPAESPMNNLTPEKMKRDGYDSVYAAAGKCNLKNDEFIIYDKRLALPMYIVHYTEGSSASISMLPGFKPIQAQQTFKIATVYPKREFNEKNPYEVQYLLAESVFYRINRIPYSSSKPAIQSIVVVVNPPLSAKFEALKSRLGCEEEWMFYGFRLDDLKDVLENNFNRKHLQTVESVSGLFFAECPESSDQYKPGCKSILLCKLLLSKSGSKVRLI